ncbi:hypothetical protein EOM86_09120, partial [Candidatus Nomurabacteria bacterium]|nr:hypothetical protein [Candidatus Nomurabacteria bacterium]
MDRKNLSGKDLLLASAVLSRYRWQFKKQINTISLDALLNYVYNKYQEDTTASSTSVLNRMMDSFESWFPIDASDTDEEIEMYKEGFARAKLCLELGEYDRDMLDYLCRIHEMVADNEEYS